MSELMKRGKIIMPVIPMAVNMLDTLDEEKWDAIAYGSYTSAERALPGECQ